MTERFNAIRIALWSVDSYAVYAYCKPYNDLQILYTGSERECYEFITKNGLEYILE